MNEQNNKFLYKPTCTNLPFPRDFFSSLTSFKSLASCWRSFSDFAATTMRQYDTEKRRYQSENTLWGFIPEGSDLSGPTRSKDVRPAVLARTTPSKKQARIHKSFTYNQSKQIMFYFCYLTKPRRSEATGLKQ